MLHTQTINPTLFRILEKLMKLDAFNGLNLVGGTSLALQIGHRESIDIDLFGNIDFDHEKLIPFLENIGNVKTLSTSRHINIFTIDGIKVDFVNYKYPFIRDIKIEHGLRLASIEDIAAMKINAIIGRGSKKDFIDLFFLLKSFSFDEIFRFYEEKFDDSNILIARKSVIYFEDAETEQSPKIFIDVSWETIKENIISQFKNEGY